MDAEHFAQIFAVSLCAWGIYSLYISFRIRRFIIKRYEQETDLLNTIFFKEHAKFTRYLPYLFSCVFGDGDSMAKEKSSVM